VPLPIGTLGEEADAVVVATQDIAEPTFFSYINASDYIRLGEKVYTRDEINADPTLLAQVRPTSCIDNHDAVETDVPESL
jgi:hypothetical protein